MTAHPPARFAGALLAPAVCVAMFASGLARADEADAFNFFIGQTLTYDDNLFRISDSIDDQRMQELLGDTRRGDTVLNDLRRRHLQQAPQPANAARGPGVQHQPLLALLCSGLQRTASQRELGLAIRQLSERHPKLRTQPTVDRLRQS